MTNPSLDILKEVTKDLHEINIRYATNQLLAQQLIKSIELTMKSK